MAIFILREGEKEGAVQTSDLPSGDVAVTCQITVNNSVKAVCSSFAGTTFNWTYKNWIVPKVHKDALYQALAQRGTRTY
ncbi:hypothetical protein [Massilia arenae]|uniref:Uncharacterized protein n=1 Tax=Massilia arenae TaxID=2603288 RepID=A0A5C7G358_9BURK|nr:hypothetical protein [Massilia arenae]TXF97151.1 hypothetical protein FVD38_21845 [Massilia arenae]